MRYFIPDIKVGLSEKANKVVFVKKFVWPSNSIGIYMSPISRLIPHVIKQLSRKHVVM